VNPWETFARSGEFGIPEEKLPFIPGSDCAGFVVRVGKNVTRLKVNHCVSLELFHSEKHTKEYKSHVQIL